MKLSTLKNKLNKLNIDFTEENNTILFSLNSKSYEAHITISNEVCAYCTSNYSKFGGRDFETFPQVLRHSQR
jgi:hypothetical protein